MDGSRRYGLAVTQRFAAFIIAACCVIALSSLTTADARSPEPSTVDWPMEHRDRFHSGAATQTIGGRILPSPLWTVPAKAYGSHVIGQGKVVYWGMDDSLIAADPATGDPIWVSPKTRNLTLGLRGHAIAGDAIHSIDYDRGYVRRLSDGAMLKEWTPGTPQWFSPTVSHGFLLSTDLGGCWLMGRDPNSFNYYVAWAIRVPAECTNGPGVAVNGDVGYIGNGGGYLTAVRVTDGTRLFSTQLQDFPYVSGSPLVDSNGDVVVGAWDGISTGEASHVWVSNALARGARYSEKGDVVSVDGDTGDIRWHAQTQGRLDAAPIEVDSTIVTVDRAGIVYGFDRDTGTQRWQWSPPGWTPPPTPHVTDWANQTLLASGDNVYVPHLDGSVYTLDGSTGQFVSQLQVPGRPMYLAVEDSSDRIYVWYRKATQDSTIIGSQGYLAAFDTSAANTEPSANAGVDQTVDEGSQAQLDASASTDPDSDPLTFAWKRTNSTGSAAALTSTTSANPSFAALDDASNRFKVTVSDDKGATSSAETSVSTRNLPPTVNASDGGAQADGAAVVSATFSDPGVLDTHSAVVDWGDGSPQESVAVTQGNGWGSAVAAHRYATTGAFTATVTVTDDDGGQATGTAQMSIERSEAAIWASSTSSWTPPFIWSGISGRVDGLAHSNGDFKILGFDNRFSGGVEYARFLWQLGLGTSISPAAVKTPASAYPINYELNDYKPGGAAAQRAGTSFFDKSSSCFLGAWTILDVHKRFKPGVYYSSCDIVIAGAHLSGNVTFVTPGDILVKGTRVDFQAFQDGLLFLAGADSNDSLVFAGSHSNLAGTTFTKNGRVSITGSNLTLTCSILAHRLYVTGADVKINASDCSSGASKSVALATVAPNAALTVGADRAQAAPGDSVQLTANVGNTGATLVASGLMGAENTGSATATATHYAYELQYQSATDGSWQTLAATSSSSPNYTPTETPTTPTSATVATSPVPWPGATYPTGSERVLGATVAAGAQSAWAYQARVSLTPSQIAMLYDSSKVSALRSAVHLEFTPSGSTMREYYRTGDSFLDKLRAQSPDLTDVQVEVSPPAGNAATFASAQHPQLARIAPGQSAAVAATYDVPTVASRGASESSESYVARLRSSNNSVMRTSARGFANTATGRTYIPRESTSVILGLPIVGLELDAPDVVDTGEDYSVRMQLTNDGLSPASAVEATSSVDGQPEEAIDGVPSELGPATSEVVEAPIVLPQSIFGTFTTTGSVKWRDGNANEYGPVDDDQSTTVPPPASLTATKSVSLAVDADGDGDPTPGDTLEYAIAIKNSAAGNASSVQFVDDVDEHTALIRGSIETTAGTISAAPEPENGRVEVNVGSIAGGATETVRFRVIVDADLPAAVSTVTNQGTITAAGTTARVTDDPDRAGADDPTVTYVNPDGPRLRVSMRDSLTDADGSASLTVNDTIAYVATIRNVGSSEATGVRFKLQGGMYTDLVGGSVTTSSGKIWDGSRFADLLADVEPGTIAPNGTATIRFKVRIASAVPAEVDYISNQATITSNERGRMVSDDPDTTQADDPTRTKARNFAALNFTKTVASATDTDGNGAVTAGDVIEYTLAVTNTTDETLSAVEVTDPLPTNLTLVEGSASSTHGSIETGLDSTDSEVLVAIGELLPNAAATVRFRARIVAPLPPGVNSISNHASVTASDAPMRLSDDPGTAMPSDATAISILPSPYFDVGPAAALATDADGNGVISPGDTVQFNTTVQNVGTANATNTTLSQSMGSNLSLVTGSVTTTPGTIQSGNSAGETTPAVNIGALPNGSTANVGFRAVVASNLPAGIKTVETTATVGATESSARTIDPALTIPVVRTSGPAPALGASKSASLALDADSDGTVSPGDTLSYRVGISNSGAGAATDVAFVDTPGVFTELVAGSVQAPASTRVEIGNGPTDTSVRVEADRIAPGAVAEVTFQVRISEAFPSSVSFVSNQGTVESFELATINTIDPAGSAPGGATRTTVTPPPKLAPIVKITGPEDGSRVTSQTSITGNIVAPTGQRISSWCLKRKAAGDILPVTVECGDGNQSGSLATFDPTTLTNGVYDLILEATATGGGTQTDRISVAIDGALKLGRYTTAYQDLMVPIHSLPIQVLRTYDSYDKQRGDFGFGWNVSIANFTVQTNGALGKGGWSAEPSGCTTVLGSSICLSKKFKRLSPHFVTVRWPDGKQEVFDFTPNAGADLYYDASAAFTGRSGSTSKLEVSGDSYIQYMSDGNIYDGDLSGHYDPQTFRLTAKDGTAYTIDKDRGLLGAEDRHGNTLTIDESGVHSSTGKSVEFQRDGSGRITSISGPTNENLSYDYSAAGDLASVTDARGNTMRFEYDEKHNLEVTKDPQNRPFRTIAYDDDGRMTAITDGAGNTTEVEARVGDRQQVVTSPDGRMTSVTSFDDRGNLTAAQESFDSTSRTSSYEYDANNNMIESVDPLGAVSRAEYDVRSNQISATDPLGRTTRFRYDSNDKLERVTRPDGTVSSSMDRSPDGDLLAVRNANGEESRFEYDEQGQMTSTSDALGRTSVFQYDGHGNPVASIDPLGNTSSVTFDDSNRPVTLTDPNGAITRFSYDEDGNIVAVVDPLSHSTLFSYDSLGRKQTETDSSGATSQFEYDAAGRLSRVTDRNGKDADFVYDESGRPRVRREMSGDETRFAYDGAGRLTSAANGDSALAFTYDQNDRLTGLESRGEPGSGLPTTSVDYEFDAVDNRLSMTVNGAITTFSYDELDRLRERDDASVGTITYDYDSSGRLASMSRPNGVVTALARNAAGELSSRTHIKGATVLDEQRFQYDGSGRLASVGDMDGAHVYIHDPAGRLTAVDNPGGQEDEFYSYDANGNRIGNGEIYDNAGRLVRDNSNVFTYDGEGRQISRTNLIDGRRTSFEWGQDSRLRGVSTPDGERFEYRYDPFGRRIEKSGLGQTTRWGYGLDPNPLAEFNSENEQTASFAFGFGADDAIAETRAGVTTFPLLDAISSTTTVSDAAGIVLDRSHFDAYGRDSGGHADSATPKSFAGRPWDSESQTFDFRARQYDPATGRFLSEDPISSANRYAYAEGTPTMFRDPSGLISTPEIGIVQGMRDMMIRTYVWGAFTSIGRVFTGAAAVGGGVACGDACNALPSGNLNSAARTAIAARRLDPDKTVVIGRGADLASPGVIREGEQALYLPQIGDPKLDWHQNSGALRLAMRLGKPIRDASPDDWGGQYLNGERLLLMQQGWSRDPSTHYWMPPA